MAHHVMLETNKFESKYLNIQSLLPEELWIDLLTNTQDY